MRKDSILLKPCATFTIYCILTIKTLQLNITGPLTNKYY
jgi:hypothetical protein